MLSYETLYPAIVGFDGTVSWNYPCVLKSTCRLNVDYFPWDQQSCELKYGSWTYDGTKVGEEHYNDVIMNTMVSQSSVSRLFTEPFI